VRLSKELEFSIPARKDNFQTPFSASFPSPPIMGAVQLITWYKSLLQLYFYLCILFRVVDGIFVLITVGRVLIFLGGEVPINKVRDTIEILRREKCYIAVTAVYCVMVPRLSQQITDKQYYSRGNYVPVETYRCFHSDIKCYICLDA
jgi:hypothetical protein